jgi:dicarboxylate transporter 10
MLRSTVAHTGVRSLYTGISASILRQMTYSMVRLGSYDEIKQRLAKLHGRSSALHLPIAAGIAGGLGGIVGNPAGEVHALHAFLLALFTGFVDILLVRMTTDSVRPPAERFGYSNAITGLVTLSRTEGLEGLMRGASANTVSNISFRTCHLGVDDGLSLELFL